MAMQAGYILRNFLLTGVLVLLLVAGAWAEEPVVGLALEEALERGLTVNAGVLAHEFGVKAADEGVRGAFGAFLPTFSLSHGVSNLHNDNETEVNTDYLDQQSDSTSITLNQPLFTGFSGIAGLRRARLGRELSRYELANVRLVLAREIRRDFYSALHAKTSVALWDESIERLKKQLELAKALYEQQLATELRLLAIEVEISRARRERESAHSRFSVSQARLANWLAWDSPDNFSLIGDLTQKEESQFPSLENALALAENQRPDIAAARLDIQRVEQERRIVAARNLPRVELEGAWNDYSRDYDQALYPGEQRRYYSVGVRLTMQPFQGGRNISEWRRLGIEIQRMKAQLRDTESRLKTEVRNAYAKWEESYSRSAAAVDARHQAEAAWRLAVRALELGAGNLRDTLDAELRLTRADLELLDARLYRRQVEAEILYVLGSS